MSLIKNDLTDGQMVERRFRVRLGVEVRVRTRVKVMYLPKNLEWTCLF